MATTRTDLLLRRIAGRCRRGFPGPALPADLVDLLRQVTEFDMACWGLLDPITLWPTTSASTVSAGDVANRAWEYELTVPDVLKLADLARGPAPVGSLWAATGGEPDRSPRYRAVLGPLSATDELRAALTINGVGWGWLALFRRTGIPFTAEDHAQMTAAVPHLARGMCIAALEAGGSAAGPPSSPAILILDQRDDLESITHNGQELLDDLPYGRERALPGVIHSLAMSARGQSGLGAPAGAPDDEPVVPARALLPAQSGGWLLLTAEQLLGAGDRVAVTIQRAGRSDVGPALLRAHGLTNRETEVALAVLRGESSKEIAAALFLSPWTVQDHLTGTPWAPPVPAAASP
ncbi:MAG: helix-turn-helix transcriptional regulator [Streptosporangiaceae bacterium]